MSQATVVADEDGDEGEDAKDHVAMLPHLSPYVKYFFLQSIFGLVG
jgi:hypothetical protein